MGKRSDMDRKERDLYQTPYEAVAPLAPFLPKTPFAFAEPCAGDGRLAAHVERVTGMNAYGGYLSDIHPLPTGMNRPIRTKDALDLSEDDLEGVSMIITNPPWSRDKKHDYILHKMIEHFTALRPTWLLFDSDWMQTKQATPYLDRLVASVAIGRVRWFEDTKMSGKDNVQWHLFHKNARRFTTAPLFFGRDVRPYASFVHQYSVEYAYQWSLVEALFGEPEQKAA
jgi:hypothetical protein